MVLLSRTNGGCQRVISIIKMLLLVVAGWLDTYFG